MISAPFGADDIFSSRRRKENMIYPAGMIYACGRIGVAFHICADGANISYCAETPRGISYAASPRISYRRKAIYHSGVSRHAAPRSPPRGRVFFLADNVSLRPGVAFSARKKGNFNRRLIWFSFTMKIFTLQTIKKQHFFTEKAPSDFFSCIIRLTFFLLVVSHKYPKLFCFFR